MDVSKDSAPMLADICSAGTRSRVNRLSIPSPITQRPSRLCAIVLITRSIVPLQYFLVTTLPPLVPCTDLVQEESEPPPADNDCGQAQYDPRHVLVRPVREPEVDTCLQVDEGHHSGVGQEVLTHRTPPPAGPRHRVPRAQQYEAHRS